MRIAAINNRKNVREIAEACVANRMKMALEPKNIEATNKTTRPVDGSEARRILNQIWLLADRWLLVCRRAASFNSGMNI
jgi:hypothetical protein